MFGVEDIFEVVSGNGEGIRPKPYPDMLNAAIDKIGCKDKSEAVYIGDSPQDPETATNAGIDGILIDRKKVYGDKGIQTLLDLIDSSLPKASD